MCIYCAGRKLWYNRRQWIILAKGACHHVSFPGVRLLGVDTEIYAFYLPNFVIYKMPNLYLFPCKNGNIVSNSVKRGKKRINVPLMFLLSLLITKMASFNLKKQSKTKQKPKLCNTYLKEFLVWMHQVHTGMEVYNYICVQLTLFNISLWLTQVRKMFKDKKFSQTEFHLLNYSVIITKSAADAKKTLSFCPHSYHVNQSKKTEHFVCHSKPLKLYWYYQGFYTKANYCLLFTIHLYFLWSCKV